MVGVDVDATALALLTHVGPGVAAAPRVVARRAAELAPHTPLALVWRLLLAKRGKEDSNPCTQFEKYNYDNLLTYCMYR